MFKIGDFVVNGVSGICEIDAIEMMNVGGVEREYYFLTPVMIMKLLEIEKLFKGTIQFVLNSDCFYVFINNSGDSLEFSMKRPIDENFINILKSQINLASAIINELKLDTEKFNENI